MPLFDPYSTGSWQLIQLSRRSVRGEMVLSHQLNEPRGVGGFDEVRDLVNHNILENVLQPRHEFRTLRYGTRTITATARLVFILSGN